MKDFMVEPDLPRSSSTYPDQSELGRDQADQIKGSSFDVTPEKDKKKELSPVLIIGFITVLTVVSLSFAAFHWFDALKIPFAVRSNISQLNANFSLTNSQVADLLTLQQKDTDLDGLSDYDELYRYQTSPYLADTDSDGFADKEEVQNNQDPNCPAGTDCGTGFESQGRVKAGLPGLTEDLTPEEIRALLIQGGMTEEQVKEFDDETLKQLYLETLAESQVESKGGSSQTFSELQPESLDLITPDQLRSLLLQEGFNEEDLNNLSNDDLRQVWQEIIKLEEGPS